MKLNTGHAITLWKKLSWNYREKLIMYVVHKKHLTLWSFSNIKMKGKIITKWIERTTIHANVWSKFSSNFSSYFNYDVILLAILFRWHSCYDILLNWQSCTKKDEAHNFFLHLDQNSTFSLMYCGISLRRLFINLVSQKGLSTTKCRGNFHFISIYTTLTAAGAKM